MSDILKCFGEILMREVRDRTIQEFDMRTSGKMKDESSQKLFEDIQQMNNKQLNLVNKIIPQVVDLSIHNMLCMLEKHMNIEIRMDNECLNEISDGLAGELYTEDGWIQKFSKQRYEEV